MTFRQFGASLGITLITTLLDWRETLHSTRLFGSVQAGAADAGLAPDSRANHH